MIKKSLFEKRKTSGLGTQGFTVVSSAQSSMPKNPEYFESWRRTIISEEQKELSKVKAEIEQKKKITKTMIESKPGLTAKRQNESALVTSDREERKKPRKAMRINRKKAKRESPVMITRNSKVYRFRRAQKEEDFVTIFSPTDISSTPTKILDSNGKEQHSLYELFWFRNHSLREAKDKGEIFFGDRSDESF